MSVKITCKGNKTNRNKLEYVLIILFFSSCSVVSNSL